MSRCSSACPVYLIGPTQIGFGRGGDAFARVELGVEFGKPRAVGAALERIGRLAA